MADASSAPASGDNSAGEKRKSVQQPVDDVEMEDLSQSRADTTDPVSTLPQGDKNKPIPVPDGETKDPPSAEPSSSAQHEAPAPLDDEDLTIDPVEPQATNGANTVNIMLQLTNGIRHPFRIDEKYLAKRNVTITGKTEDGNPDPASITVYTFKELILRDWRQDWEEPPREPSSIRLIHFGKLLEDRNQLSHYNFSTTNKNWVHMTVKPQDLLDEEEAAKKTKDSSSQSGRSGCCVIL